MDANLKEEWSSDTLGPFGEQNDTKTPFNVYFYPNLLEDQFVGQLRDDINSSIKLRPKDNDLYKFKQSKDFKTEIPAKKLTPLLHDFIDLMLGKIRQRLEKVTGKTLSNKNFDITASRYDVGNYLLCHNDDIKDNLKLHARSLAFIYYLNSRPWTREDGGALILYESDDAGEPVKINNSILPRPNTLVVFETSSTSWHSVEEVYCKDDFRLSINGWFHTDGQPGVRASESEPIIEPCPYRLLKPIGVDERIEKIFKEYFNQEYLMEKTCLLIRKQFKRKSEINLTNFLVKEKFEEISTALREATMNEENLVHVGPYNKRNYRRLKIDKLPPICKDLYDTFQSELFFMLLSRLTGLDLQPPSIKPDQEEEEANCDDNDVDDDEDDSDEESDEDEDNEDEDEDEEEEDEDEDEEEDEVEDDDDETAADNKEGQSNNNNQTVGELDKSSVEKYSHGKEADNKPEEISEGTTSTTSSSRNKGEPSEHQVEEPTTSKEKLLEQVKNQSPRKRVKVSDPLARIEFRHLESGSYTLIHDHGFELGEKSSLDVMLHLNHDFPVNFDDGGYTKYIDGAPDDDLHDMDYELLTVEPKSNCLSLVYRCDEGTCRFLKYISKSHKANYQDLSCVYYERPEDLPKCDPL